MGSGTTQMGLGKTQMGLGKARMGQGKARLVQGKARMGFGNGFGNGLLALFGLLENGGFYQGAETNKT